MFAQNHVSRIHSGLIRVDVDKFQRSNSFHHKLLNEKTLTDINARRHDKKTVKRASTIHVDETKSKEISTPGLTTTADKESLTMTAEKEKPRLTSEPINMKKTGPSYERTLLKKKIEDTELKLDDDPNGEKQVRSSSLDRKFWKKNRKDELKNLTKRHHSFSHQKKRHSQLLRLDDVSDSAREIKRISSFTYKPNNRAIVDRGYQSASPHVKHKILRNSKRESPRNSVSSETSAQSRRTSLRRSKSIDLSNEDMTEIKPEETTRKMSRFRRRRSSDNSRMKYRQSSKQSVTKVENKRSRLIRLYSGGADDGKCKGISDVTNDIITDQEEYSSAASDMDFRQDKRKPGFMLKVWRSINSLFQPNDERPTRDIALLTGTPPLMRRINPDKRLSQSLPEGLHTDRLILKDSVYSKKPYSPLIYEKQFQIENEPEKANSNRKKQRYKRSKSAEYLSGLIRNSSFSRKNTSQFSRKQSLPAKIGSRNSNLSDSKYSIIISQKPGTISQITKEEILNDNNNNDVFHDRKQISETEHVTKLKTTLNNELKMFLKDKTFYADEVNTWCRTLSECIKNKVILLTHDDYKVVTQVFIGALVGNGIHAAVQSNCSQNDDVFLTASYRNDSMYAMASLLTYKLALD